MTTIEAAHMGRPIITTDADGNPETVLHMKTGLIVKFGDEQDLVDAVSYLLDDPQLAQKMGDAGLRYAREVFILERMVDSYEQLYNKLYRN